MNRRAFLAGLLITPFFINGILAGATATKEPEQNVIKVSNANRLGVGDNFTIEGFFAVKGGRSIKGLHVFTVEAIHDDKIVLEPLTKV